MDNALVRKAIENAIAGGCQRVPPIVQLAADTNFVREQADVAGAPEVLRRYFDEIAKDADMATLNGLFAAGPAGGVSIGLEAASKVLLAQCLLTGDIDGTIARFSDHLVNNRSKAIAVMAISGVKTKRPVKLGPVTLVALSDVPPSAQRGIALAQPGGPPGPRFPLPSALTVPYVHTPVYYKPETPQPLEKTQSKSADAAFSLLEEAKNLLGLVSVFPAVRMLWSQPENWIEVGGLTGGWQTAPGPDFSFDREIDADAAEAIAGTYFAIDDGSRAKVLRIPLDRLNKANAEREFTDRVIDLGIGLEALLLHDLGDDRGELTLRFALHGAWLLGQSEEDRDQIRVALRDMYKLRSTAVHVGYVELTEKNVATYKRASELCNQLVRKLIDYKCKVNWSRLLTGGAP